MEKLKYIVFLFVLVSCKSANKSSVGNLDSLAGKGLNYEYIQNKIKESKSKPDQQGCDFKNIRKQISSYKDLGIVSIPIAENIIKRCISSLDESNKDSVYILFVNLFYNSANPFTESLETKYSGVLKKIEKDINDSETKDFKKCLDVCGLTLLMSEGTYYVDVKYDYFYNLFKGKVSPALDVFLKIRSKEMKQGYSEDAGLLISFEELYDRVTTWEDFNIKYPDFFLNGESESYYISYLSTFLTGMDNSRTFDLDNEKLLPELKKLYEKIIERKDARKSSKIISDYYDLLKNNDFKQPDNLSKFLKDNGLFSMLGVQPETR
ncbi:MAG: hypothetical protein Q8928_03360 [Bacteroidota bacterium]|nr:hypothetical protein [Bacteroidota bacterium]